MKQLFAKHTIAALLFTCCFLICFVAQAQETEQEREDRTIMMNIDRDHDKTIKLHPLHYGEVFVSYEKVRAPSVSNEFGLSYFYKLHMKGDGWTTNTKDVLGIGIRMSQRYYTSKKKPAPFGFFHGPMFSYRFIVFERNVFDLPDLPPNDPDFRYVGRLYQNALDLSYHLGYQFQLGRHFTTELSGGIGGRVKIANATNGADLIKENIIGHVVHSDDGAVITVGPSPQLNFSIGYSF
ncbi:ABC transporter ATP-binding protein [Pontibacter sp. HSC-14F20]|uniref:ABC transporter ATP-binding protein n=1 Tax=Pontibacter sp. HSC-14F20 TaxID=2864136 RepID=UPI001C733BF8|nr:ABC transporter ATP-binding protein [Pontibacter sp. HSC-14F20]MBX0333813.1 ABC transporter ATP-binding protein [Pontibacter sp. HSC-14F20]